MKLLKWFLWLIGGLLLLTVLAVVAIVLFFDPNDHRDRIIAAVEAQTGREFSLDGPIEWSLFPWLAITAGPVSLGNDPDFGQADFLSAQRVSAELRLLPLLRREIEIGEVRLDAPSLRLQVNEAGRGNWESLAEGSEGDDPPADDSTGTLSIQSITLSDGTIDYLDRGSGLEFQLRDLDLEASPVRADSPLDVELSTNYESADLAGRLEASALVRDLLADSAPTVDLRALSVSSRGEPALELALTEPASLDLERGTLRAPEFSFRSHQAAGTGSLQGTGLADSPRFQGRVQTATFDLGAWLRDSGLYTEPMADPDALGAFQAAFEWTMADEAFDVSALQAELDGSKITGSARVADRITFGLDIDRLDADRYMPPESDRDEPEDEPAEVKADFGPMRGTIVVGELVLAGLTASQVSLTIESDENGIRLMPIEGQLYGGTVQAQLGLNGGADGELSARADVTGVNAQELLKVWVAPAPLAGTGTLSADLRLGRPFDASPLRSLDGTLSMNLEDGAIYGLNVMQVLRQVLIATGRGGENLSGEARSTDFSSLDLKADIEQGILRTRSFLMVSPYLRVKGSGQLDLAAGEIDYQLVPTLVSSPEGQGSAGLDQLEGTAIPLSLSGSLTAPSVSFDARAALVASQGDKLKQKLREKLDVGEDAGSETGEDPEPSDALKGLLLEAIDKELDGKKKKDDGDSL